MVLIPVHGKAGIVLAYATVDDADAPDIASYHWRLSTNGYAERFTRRGGQCAPLRRVLMHRSVIGLAYGDGLIADHINRDKLDNRRCNLRVVTAAQNAQNQPSDRASTSTHRGVHWDAKARKWQARVFLDGRLHYLGSFPVEADAATAAQEFRLANMTHAID